jgi:hypothetical protein
MEPGYRVALVGNATAAFDEAGMDAAHEVNGPRVSRAMVTIFAETGVNLLHRS